MSHGLPRIAVERLRHAAFLVCAVAAIGLGSEIVLISFQYPQIITPRNRSKEFFVAAPEAVSAGGGNAAADMILKSPLFVQGRGKTAAPAIAKTPPPPSPAPEPDISLVGVQIFDDMRLAIIRVSGSEDSLRAVEGQPIAAGWSVARILRDHVELRKESRTRSIYLADTKPPIDDEDASP